MEQSTLKKYISQYNELQKEIEYYNKKIRQLNANSTVHSVVSSSMGPPSFAKTSITISGTEIKSDYKRKKYQKFLITAKDKQLDIVINLEKEIQKIDDCLVRLGIRYKYIEGLEWKQVAQKIGGNNTAESIRKTVHRYLDSI